MKSAKTVRLGDVCEVINGLWKGVKPPFKRVGIIRSTNFTKWCELTLDNTAYIDVEEKKYQSRKLQAGDLIVERSGGTTDSPVGRIVLFNVSKGDYSISNFTSILRVKDTEALDPLYLHRYLKSLYFQGKTKDIQTNTTNIHNLDFNAYLDFEIPLPPLSEQKAIAARLDAALARATRLAEHFTTIAQNADLSFKAALAETFENVSDKEVRLGDLGTIIRGKGIRRAETTSHGKACLRYGEIYTSYQIVLDKPKSFVPEAIFNSTEHIRHGDLVFTLTGENKEDIGKTLVYLGDDEIAAGGDLAIWRVPNCNPKWLCYLMQSGKMLKAKAIASSGNMIVHLSLRKFQEIEIPLPPLSVQHNIVARLDAARARCDGIAEQARRGAAAAENLKKALLNEAFE